MAQSRDIFEIPHTRERFTFTKRPSATSGDLLEIEFLVKEFSPPAHIHVDLEERVEVLEGRARVRVGRKEWTVGPGETVVFPAGTAHGFRAEGEEMLRFRCEVVPPREMESLFETIFGIYRDGSADKRGQPNPLQNVVLAHEHKAYLAGPPIWLQKPFIAALAFVARRLGYRARYEKYSDKR
jgi:mannose-6-phosphate isomerase-like protein (cupin superfamily)